MTQFAIGELIEVAPSVRHIVCMDGRAVLCNGRGVKSMMFLREEGGCVTGVLSSHPRRAAAEQTSVWVEVTVPAYCCRKIASP